MSLYRRMLGGRRLRDLDLEDHLSDPARKQEYVTFLFDFIAPGYDLFTRVFSFGMDQGWKRTMLREIGVRASGVGLVVDLACGTGDLARGAASAVPGARVVGVDVSREMLREAVRLQGQAARPTYAVGDILRLGLADGSVDAITMGYGLRNTPDLNAGLREIFRVLRPGGLLVNLDFYKPANALWRRIYLGYMKYAGAAAGWLWHREPVSYAYITPSIQHYVTAEEFSSSLVSHGFDLVRVHRRLGGGIAIHAAIKRQADVGA